MLTRTKHKLKRTKHIKEEASKLTRTKHKLKRTKSRKRITLLKFLRSGDKFTVTGTDMSGEVQYVNICRAYVKLDKTIKIKIGDVEFSRAKLIDIAPTTEVEITR